MCAARCVQVASFSFKSNSKQISNDAWDKIGRKKRCLSQKRSGSENGHDGDAEEDDDGDDLLLRIG